MKKILLIVLIAASGFGSLEATERSTVLIVKASTESSLGSSDQFNDEARRKLAEVYQICSQRNVDTRTYIWDGNATNLKAFIREPEIEFVVFVGGCSWHTPGYLYPAGADDLGHFWGHDSTYCNKHAFVWFENGSIHTATDHYVSGAIDDQATKSVSRKGHFYTANYSGALDTLPLRGHNSNVYGKIVAIDPNATGVDSILTFTGYDLADGDHYAGLWSRTENGMIRYYSALYDGSFGMMLDSKICKHVTHFRRLEWALDLDDFGMHRIMGGVTTFPNAASVTLTHDNFFAHIDTLFQSIIQYDMKLSIGTVTDDLRNSAAYADSNQWAEWWDLVQKYKDNSHFQWVWHNHGHENLSDSVSATFYNWASYNDSPYDFGNLPTVAYIDSVYQSDCDSIEAWGLTVAPYLIPPTDRLAGLNSALKDTIMAFLKLNKLAAADKICTAGRTSAYWDYTRDGDAKILLRYYISSSDTSDLAINEIAFVLWHSWGSNFAISGSNDGLNPDIASTGTWHSSARVLSKKLYSQPVAKIGVLHTASSYNQENWDYNGQVITLIGETIEYLEWLAGKDLYECVFAQDIDWEQVK